LKKEKKLLKIKFKIQPFKPSESSRFKLHPESPLLHISTIS